MAQVLAHARDIEGLQDIDAVLHDLAFSMEQVRYADDRGLVTVVFHVPTATHDAFYRKLWRRERRKGVGPRNVEISNVSSIEVRDTAGIVEHTYARLVASASNRLTLKSNFPGSVEMVVTGIDVRVTA